jgi:hypothetical protein
MNKTKKNIFLYGCRGYSYNLFTEKIEDYETKHHIIRHLIKANQPTKDEGIIKCIRYNINYSILEKMKEIPNNSLIQIFKPGFEVPRLSFVVKNNTIYFSWSKKKCTLKNKYSTQPANKFNIRKVKVTNLFEKLNEFIKDPTYSLFKKIFKINNSYITEEQFKKDYLNIKIYVYTL